MTAGAPPEGGLGGEEDGDEDLLWAMPLGHLWLGGAGEGGGPPAGVPCRPPSPAPGRGVMPPQRDPAGGKAGGRGPITVPLSPGGS